VRASKEEEKAPVETQAKSKANFKTKSLILAQDERWRRA
jgi:hypothetical protein